MHYLGNRDTNGRTSMLSRGHVTEDQTPEFPRGKLVATIVVIAFAVLGFVIAPFIAPDMPTWRSGLGGALLGAFSGAAAVMNRILE